jgi:type IV pilus assembly protein PilB
MEIKSNMLGELLLEAGLIDQFQLDSALSFQRNLGGQIGAALIKLGYLPDETIVEFLEKQQLYSRVSLEELTVDPLLLELLPVQRMQQLKVFPVELRYQGKEKVLRVAMTDPTDLRLIENLQFITGCRVMPLMASEEDILRAITMNEEDDLYLQDCVEDLEEFFDGNLVNLTPELEIRFDRLLQVLKEKGSLSKADIERINSV